MLAVIDDLIAIVVSAEAATQTSSTSAASTSRSSGDYRKLKVKLLQRVTTALLPNIGLVQRQQSTYRTVRQLKTQRNNTATNDSAAISTTSSDNGKVDNNDDDDDLSSFVLPPRFEELIDILLTALHDADGDGKSNVHVEKRIERNCGDC